MSNEPHSLAEPTPTVRVASYSNTTWQGSWRQRARAVWGTGTFGLLWGAGLGALVGLAVFSFGTGMAFGIVPALALAGAAAGGGIGMVIADSVGSASGAVSAGMAEWESRFKQMMVEAKLFNPSMVQEEPVSAALNRTEMVDTPEEVNLRGRMVAKAVNWPGLATFAALGGGLGAIFGGANLIAIPAGMLAIIGAPAAAAGAVAIAGGAVLGAGFGAVFGVNCPVITNKMNNAFAKIFSGEAFGTKPSPVITPTPVVAPEASYKPVTKRELMMVGHEEGTRVKPNYAERIEAERAAIPPNQIH